MKIIHLTSTSFAGYIEYIFGDNDLLEKMEVHATLSEKQQVFLLKNMPREIPELEKLRSANVTLTEMNAAVPTFEMFWNRYDDKINSSRKRTERKWYSMSPANKGRAYNFILRYFANIPAGTRKKYAETYLNDELWNN
jgi:hypothetical protein